MNQLPWNKIKELPIRMYQTIRGPLMGHARVYGHTVRLYAPANVGMPDERHIMWMPLLFCEEYLDLMADSAAVFGEHPAPPIVEQGYHQFVEEFMQGSYKMKPLVAEVGVDAEAVVKEDTRIPVAPNTEPPLTTCASCGKTGEHTENCPTRTEQ